jgi:hypothetical protein
VLEPADVISFRLEPLRSGEQIVTVTTAEKPAFVGVDPYSKFVDRQGDDNITAVEDAD